jgi:hypothetical protein
VNDRKVALVAFDAAADGVADDLAVGARGKREHFAVKLAAQWRQPARLPPVVQPEPVQPRRAGVAVPQRQYEAPLADGCEPGGAVISVRHERAGAGLTHLEWPGPHGVQQGIGKKPGRSGRRDRSGPGSGHARRTGPARVRALPARLRSPASPEGHRPGERDGKRDHAGITATQ